MPTIPIFLSSDNNYAPFVATTIASICDNTNSFCNFYILDGGITKENQDKICELKNQFKNFSIEFVKINTEKYFKDFMTNSYITVATYYRFIIPFLFPNIQKAIYLDVDIIALGDIADLFSTDLGKYILGAVEDCGSSDYIEKCKKNIEIDLNSVYFNAGVLVIDLEKWRDKEVSKSLFQIENKYRGELLCNDQDILNKYFENNYMTLDKKYNSLDLNKDTVLRHYYGPVKPWHFHPDICYKKLEEFKHFWNFASKTMFYNQILSNCKYKTIHSLQLYKLYKRQSQKIQNKEKSI